MKIGPWRGAPLKKAYGLVLATLLLVAVPAPPVRAADPTQTLSGETLIAAEVGGAGGTSEVTGECNAIGPSTFTFTVMGAAFGPYPGEFVETGTFTLEPSVGGGFTVKDFQATFTILSPSTSTEITGTKTLASVALLSSAFGFCGAELGPNAAPDATYLLIPAHYSARIRNTVTGHTFTDEGDNPVVDYGDFGVRDIPNFQGFSFLQTFVSRSQPGKATGGGQIEPDVTFGFVAMDGPNGFQGRCSVVDHATSTRIECLDVASYAQVANRAVFSGRALQNGVETTYTIEVQDNGEPGSGTDMFSITTGSGYSAGGIVTKGDVQVHL